MTSEHIDPTDTITLTVRMYRGPGISPGLRALADAPQAVFA